MKLIRWIKIQRAKSFCKYMIINGFMSLQDANKYMDEKFP